MATKKAATEVNSINDITTTVTIEDNKYKGPMVTVFLPELEDSGSEGLKVDQYEHVTIANEDKEIIYRIHRGEPVEIPVPVFMVLKEKYPKL